MNKALQKARTGNTTPSCFRLCSITIGQSSCSFLVNSARIEAGAMNNILINCNLSSSGSQFRIKAKGLIVDDNSPANIYYTKDGVNVDIYMAVNAGYVTANLLPLYMSSEVIDVNPIVVSEIPEGATEVSIQ